MAAPLPHLPTYDLAVSHQVEWLWWSSGLSGSVEHESMQAAFEEIANLHITAGETGEELSTVYTRKTYRKEPDKDE